MTQLCTPGLAVFSPRSAVSKMEFAGVDCGNVQSWKGSGDARYRVRAVSSTIHGWLNKNGRGRGLDFFVIAASSGDVRVPSFRGALASPCVDRYVQAAVAACAGPR